MWGAGANRPLTPPGNRLISPHPGGSPACGSYINDARMGALSEVAVVG